MMQISKPGFAGALTVAIACCGPTHAAPRYAQVDSWTAPDALWDYASVDAQTRRLYVGRFGGVLTVDLKGGKVTPVLLKATLVHGVAILPEGKAAASSDGDNKVLLFDGRSGRVEATVVVGHGPDSIAYEPRYKLVAVTDQEDKSISLVDPDLHLVAATIKLDGSPEAVVADGHGKLYDNIDDKHQIAVIDIASRKVVKYLDLPGCDRPTGIAYDDLRRVVISACRNGVVDIIAAGSGEVLSTLQVGAGPDAVMSDTSRGVAFVPSGAAGMLNVIALAKDGRGTVVQSVATMKGTRTGAVDPLTGRVYLPAALLQPGKPGQPHALVPGSFRILVYGPG